jgi:hypothetical protein
MGLAASSAAAAAGRHPLHALAPVLVRGSRGCSCYNANTENHWLHGFNYNVEEWFEGDRYETPAICRQLAYARAVFKAAIAERPTGKFMSRSRTRVVKRYPDGDW